ncbi:hypothetical protein [Nocardia abscessus]|uniref:hypothetical protein n=1 Tax=Nocardia abscessus TaxID=120957 RepID=UPI002455699E|nr:hypothetical protein [Nocardia abscessus]
MSVPAVRDLSAFFNAKYRVVGTLETIVHELAEWASAGIDGINVISIVTPGSYAEFIDHLVPVLQECGLMKREYASGTLRQDLRRR